MNVDMCMTYDLLFFCFFWSSDTCVKYIFLLYGSNISKHPPEMIIKPRVPMNHGMQMADTKCVLSCSSCASKFAFSLCVEYL